MFIRAHVAAGRLLDIGCAYGFFLQEAKPFYEVSGNFSVKLEHEPKHTVGRWVLGPKLIVKLRI